jgi:type VI secretion system secreted protein Hcp
MKRAIVVATLAAVLLTGLGIVQASAAYEFYMKVTGTKQGVFKHEGSMGVGPWGPDAMPCLSMTYEAKSPTDAATGMATGKTQFLPLTVTKEWGAASPQLFQALLTNEVLKDVTLSFVQTTPEGAKQMYFTITLKNAVITNYRMRAGQAARTAEGTGANQAAYDTHEVEDISFRYESITVTSATGGTTAVGGGERGIGRAG